MVELSEQISRRLFPAKTPKGDRTKLRMIEATIQSIAEEGLDRVTFESIGKRLGIKPAQVRYHFVEKDDLIDKAINFVLIHHENSIIKGLKKTEGRGNQIRSLSKGYFDWIDRHPEQGATLLAFYHLARVHEKYRETHNQMFQSGSRRIMDILTQGGAKPGNTALLLKVGLSIWATIDGYLLYALTTGLNHKPSLRKQALEAIERIIAEHQLDP